MVNMINVPEDVQELIQILKRNGYEAYIVGGCVRDSIIGRKPKDWDICTNADPWEVIKLFETEKYNVIPTGLEYGTVTVVSNKVNYEITTYRIDGEYRNSRFPEIQFADSLVTDLSRRDFTMNAMAYDYESDTLIDPFNGWLAIKQETIKCVGNASDRFKEDALRILRAIRFSAQLGFDIDSNDKYAIYKERAGLKNISGERIRAELNKILIADPSKLETFAAEVAFDVVIPELTKLREISQNNPYHIYDVYGHTIEATRYIELKLHLRLAALFHDLGKAETKTTDKDGIDHFYGHEVPSERLADIVLRRLKYDNATVQKVTTLIKYHSRRVEPNKKAIKRFINQIGENLFFDWCKLRWADICAQNPVCLKERAKKIFIIEQLGKEIIDNKEPFSRKDLAVDGRDLIAIGFESGTKLGETLNELLDIVIDNPENNTHEYLIEIARNKLAINE